MSGNRLREHPARWTGALVALVIALPVLAVIGTYVWVHSSNNATAQHIEEQLLALPLPPGTELVDSAWAAQRLAPAGNGMEYAGALLLRSERGLDELEAFYENQAGAPRVTASNDELLGRQTLLFDADHDLSQPDFYLVIARAEPESRGLRDLDLRGH